MDKISMNPFNYIIGIILIVITFPFQLIIAVILALELKENPFFIQERGLAFSNGRFRMIKFKTIKTHKLYEPTGSREFLIPIDEKHITRFANLLRKSGLDELPQLYHIMSGKMNLVGPRPLMLEDLVIMKDKYPAHYKKRELLKIKPGITGLWQLYGNKFTGIKDLIKFDIKYAQKKSFWFDLEILIGTLLYILRGGRKFNQ